MIKNYTDKIKIVFNYTKQILKKFSIIFIILGIIFIFILILLIEYATLNLLFPALISFCVII